MRFRRFVAFALLCTLYGLTAAWETAHRPVITKTNIDQLHQIASVGRGQVVNIVWSPDSRWVAVATTGGVWLYDSISPQTEPKHFGSSFVQALAFSEDSSLISAAGWDDIVGGTLL